MARFVRALGVLSVFSIFVSFFISSSISASLKGRAQQAANDGTLLIAIANHDDVRHPESQISTPATSSAALPALPSTTLASDGTQFVSQPSANTNTGSTNSIAESIGLDPWLNSTFATPSNNQSTLSVDQNGLPRCNGDIYGQGLQYISCATILSQIPGDQILRSIGQRGASSDYKLPFRLMSCEHFSSYHEEGYH